MTQGKKLSKYGRTSKDMYSLSGFTGFPGVVPLSIASVDANNISNVLNFPFRGPVPETFFFFFSQPMAGLTNQVPVRDSRAGAPLLRSGYRESVTVFPPRASAIQVDLTSLRSARSCPRIQAHY